MNVPVEETQTLTKVIITTQAKSVVLSCCLHFVSMWSRGERINNCFSNCWVLIIAYLFLWSPFHCFIVSLFCHTNMATLTSCENTLLFIISRFLWHIRGVWKRTKWIAKDCKRLLLSEQQSTDTGSRGDVFVVRTSKPVENLWKNGLFWSCYSFVTHSIDRKPRDWGLARSAYSYSALHASVALRATCCAPPRLWLAVIDFQNGE